MSETTPSHPAGVLEMVDSTNKLRLSRLTKLGKAVRLASGIYVHNAVLPPKEAARHHRFAIIAHFWPGAVLCDRTALSGGEPVDGHLYICMPELTRKADLVLPGFTISARTGPGRLPGDMGMPNGLHLSGVARGLVENVSTAGRPKRGVRRVAGTADVEDRIDELARTSGAGGIQNVLRQLDAITEKLPRSSCELVRSRLAALLGTYSKVEPISSRLRARLSGHPYDEHRLDMFTRLADLLVHTAPVPRPAVDRPTRWKWLPFFESYFSNFIEGTKFDVEEARRIAIDGDIPASRPQDAHDITATFKLASDPEFASVTLGTSEDLLEVLRAQHEILMSARPDMRPGQFKTRPNYAGGYRFVTPELLVGTLERGFDIFGTVYDPFQRAVAISFLIAECHPFDDGNGRISRLIANAVLSGSGQIRIVIPSVFRNNYLDGLTSVSNGADKGGPLISVLSFAQRWTAMLDWTSFEVADAMLKESNAYEDSAFAESRGVRLKMPTFM